MNINKEAKNIYLHFSKLPGSQLIASEHAIRGLMKWLTKRKPKHLLEVGAGIGTLTFASLTTLAQHRNQRNGELKSRFIAIESNGFCLTQLNKNLEGWENCFNVINDISALPDKTIDFDFVIIDGGELDDRYFLNLSPGATVFIEGYRGEQRARLESVSEKRRYIRAGLLSLSLREKGGYWVYQFEPSLSDLLVFGLMNCYARVWGAVKYRLKAHRPRRSEAV